MEKVKRNFPEAEMSAWLIPLSHAYFVALLLYDKVCQDWLNVTKTLKKLPTLDNAHNLLKNISEVNNHTKTMTTTNAKDCNIGQASGWRTKKWGQGL